MIYIATNIHGRGVKHITGFDSRLDFWAYADEVLACHDRNVPRSASVADICDGIYDNGIGSGARDHFRVSRREAARYIRHGADAHGCWSL